jgi:hypothetical protein
MLGLEFVEVQAGSDVVLVGLILGLVAPLDVRLDRLDELGFVHDARSLLAGQSRQPSSPNEDRMHFPFSKCFIRPAA